MGLGVTSVANITPAIDPCQIQVRVARLWGFPRKDKPTEFSGIDMLLVDDEGGRIQASIKGNLVTKFQKQVKEGEFYVMMNFELGPNLGQFRSCAHPYKINFGYYTFVKQCDEISNQDKRFNFVNFSEIITSTASDTFFDIIGEVIGMNDIKDLTTSFDGPTKILDVQLKDLENEVVDVSIWGKLALDIHSQIESQSSSPVIFLGSLMKTQVFRGKTIVQSSKFSTKVMINAPIPEIIDFKKSLSLCEPQTSLSISTIESKDMVYIAKSSFKLSDKKSIAQLHQLDKDMICNVYETICSVESKHAWFYIGCIVCKKKVTPYFNPETEELDPNKFSCQKCRKQIISTQPRFKLAIQAKDDSDVTSLMLFDDVVNSMVKKSAYELLEQQVELKKPDEIPQELLDLNGRSYVFKVVVTDSATWNRPSTKKVISFTQDPATMKCFADFQIDLNAIEPDIASLSGTSVATPSQSIVISSADDNLDKSGAKVTLETPTSKRPLPVSDNEVNEHSTTNPKAVKRVPIKKEKK